MELRALRFWASETALLASVGQLVHPGARRDRRAFALHSRFILIRIMLACAGCVLAPLVLLAQGTLTALQIAIVVGCVGPLSAAVLLSRTGRIDLATRLSLGLEACAIGAMIWQTGGLSGPAAALLALLPMSGSVTGARKSFIEACLVAIMLALALVILPQSSIVMVFPSEIITGALVCLTVLFAGFVADRGERHAAAQMRSQARAAAALDAVPDVVLWREDNGDISFANAAANRVLGLDRRDLDSRALFERVNIGDRPAWLKALSDAVSTGTGTAPHLRISCGAMPEVRLFSCRISRVGADGALLIALSDITERTAAESLREDARREAERIASSKSQFMATMSHELRTPLNAIIGFSEILKTPELIAPTDPRRDEYARIIHESGQHLLEVVNAILDMSKIESGMMVIENDRVNVPALLQSSRELVAVKAAQKSIAIVESIVADLPEIVSDRRALKQVLLNLMSNAVKFTPEGGDVTVTAVRDRDHIEIAVTDSGIGMSEDNLRQIGTPFFQVAQSYDRKHEGTGLGLSVVRGLVGLMGGSVLVESALGEGTRVALRLPIAGPGASGNIEPVRIETRVKARRTFAPALPQQNEDNLRRSA